MKRYFKIKLLIFSLFFVAQNLLAQETIIVGQTINRLDRSPIPAVNIFFKNTSIGVQSDNDGYFMIKTTGQQSTLVFSAIGFRKREISLKAGKSVGLDVLMEEENTLLQEVFVIPGANPALDLMKKVRMLTEKNDISRMPNYASKSTEQSLVLMSKNNQKASNNRIFNQLKKANLSNSDTSLVIPLYMHTKNFQISSREKQLLSKNIFSSPEIGEQIITHLLGEIEPTLNFYENVISIFGKSMVSPLSKMGNAYYDYFLADSISTLTGKQYQLHFRTKNVKNLAFNGKLWVDSASLAITKIEGELPNKANINYLNNFRISQQFKQLPNKQWSPFAEEMALSLTNELFADSLHPNAEIFIKRSATYQIADSLYQQKEKFASSNYTETNLNEKLNELNNTPVLRTAKFLADVIFTGYIPMGKIDIGKVQQIMRITDIEGFRLSLPFRTNEKLWKNASVGGYIGYGFRNEKIKYSGISQVKLDKKRHGILSVNYTNDYRRIDYNYNNYMFRENPLVNGDEDISSSVFAFKSAGKISERNEFTLSYSSDWNSDIETSYYFRSNKLFANASLPMKRDVNMFSALTQQSATVVTRFSFNEKTYLDHLQRIYIANNKPVIYSILEVGKYSLGNTSGNYAKIMASIKHKVRLGIGQFSYIADAGYFIGKMPFPLLQIHDGSETGGYSTYQFNMMNYFEYASDKYINFHSEFMMNGLILNQIPIVKNFNLREMVSFNLAYGGLSNSHRELLDYPSYMQSFTKPYMEVGIGFTNIFKLFTLQSVWRLTDLNKPGVSPWGIRGCISIGF